MTGNHLSCCTYLTFHGSVKDKNKTKRHAVARTVLQRENVPGPLKTSLPEHNNLPHGLSLTTKSPTASGRETVKCKQTNAVDSGEQHLDETISNATARVLGVSNANSTESEKIVFRQTIRQLGDGGGGLFKKYIDLVTLKVTK